jgi:putative phosphoesterase
MKLGVVSDVHNHVEALEYALGQLRDSDLIVQLGDLVSDYRADPRIIDLARRRGLVGILGNHEKGILLDRASRVRASLAAAELSFLEQLPPGRELEWDGRRIGLAHGAPWDEPAEVRCAYVFAHDAAALSRVAASGCQVVVLGHTHQPMMQRLGGTLIMNPGSCGEARGPGSQLTFGWLDTRLGQAAVYAIRHGQPPELVIATDA